MSHIYKRKICSNNLNSNILKTNKNINKYLKTVKSNLKNKLEKDIEWLNFVENITNILESDYFKNKYHSFSCDISNTHRTSFKINVDNKPNIFNKNIYIGKTAAKNKDAFIYNVYMYNTIFILKKLRPSYDYIRDDVISTNNGIPRGTYIESERYTLRFKITDDDNILSVLKTIFNISDIFDKDILVTDYTLLRKLSKHFSKNGFEVQPIYNLKQKTRVFSGYLNRNYIQKISSQEFIKLNYTEGDL